MRKLPTCFLLAICSGLAVAEDCHVIIKQNNLQKQTLDGQEMYVVAVADVKSNQCFKPVETAEKIKALQKQVDDNLQLAEAYKQNQEALQKLNDDYSALIQRHEQTLNKSITVSENFETNMQNYNQLAKDYDQLTGKFDELAGKYRDVALSSGSPITFDFGAGLTDEGDWVGLLGAGFHVYKAWDIKAWGMAHKDFYGILGGASVRF